MTRESNPCGKEGCNNKAIGYGLVKDGKEEQEGAYVMTPLCAEHM